MSGWHRGRMATCLAIGLGQVYFTGLRDQAAGKWHSERALPATCGCIAAALEGQGSYVGAAAIE